MLARSSRRADRQGRAVHPRTARAWPGHSIFATANGRAKWLFELDSLLRALKLPTWTSADVDAMMKRLSAREGSRAFLERYISGPLEKALARETGGSYLSDGFGGVTMDLARRSAMEFCQRVKPNCEIVMENDKWLGSGL